MERWWMMKRWMKCCKCSGVLGVVVSGTGAVGGWGVGGAMYGRAVVMARASVKRCVLVMMVLLPLSKACRVRD